MNTRVCIRRVAFACFAATFAPPSAAALETVLVAAGSPMVYRANTADPGLGTTWTAEAFTPSGWSSGSYGVGYDTASPPNASALFAQSVPSSSTASIYTRATFNVADVSQITSLHIGADYDDGYVAWINGVEVYRSSQMPGGAPAWNTTAASHESSNGSSPNYGTLVNISAAGLGAIHNGSNVLAVGVWNTPLPSSDLVLVPKLSANASVSRGPYQQMGTPDSVVVRWRTFAASDSCVRYGTVAGSLTSSACLPASVTDHVVPVTGLLADTKYYYSVGSSTTTQEGDTANHFFVTSPEVGTPKATRMWILGDSGTADSNAAAVRDAFLSVVGGQSPDLWLMLGDNAYNDGTDSQYQNAVFNMYPTVLRNSVLWPTLGNHDGHTANSSLQSGPYYDIFTLPAAAQAGGLSSGTEAYYSFDYGDIHFVCLESYETDRSAGGAMMTWLAADLADNLANWTIVFFHHPPYSKGSHDSDVETELVQMRANALPIMEAAGVDLVLSGHSHSYERSFLLDGHYGVSGTLTPAMKLDAGDGREAGTGAYQKPGGGPAPNEGAVYVVAGSSGQADADTLDHPAMHVSMAVLGSMIIDVDGDRLDAQFIDDNGDVLDSFTIEKPLGEFCGNGTVEGTEECDDANAISTDACLNDCQDAVCGDGFVRTDFEECDDGNVTPGDGCSETCVASCASVPRTDCLAAGLSKLAVATFAEPARDFVKWQWSRGAPFDAADLGDPVWVGSYELCFYPDGALAADVVVPPGPPWLSREEKGYQYSDRPGTIGGISDIRISAGAEGRTKLKVRGRGVNLPSGLVPATSYTIQLLDLAGGNCWSSAFSSGTTATATLFKGRSELP